MRQTGPDGHLPAYRWLLGGILALDAATIAAGSTDDGAVVRLACSPSW